MTIPAEQIEVLAKQIADDLFLAANGETADSLNLISKAGRYLGGWSYESVRRRILTLLAQELRALLAAAKQEEQGEHSELRSTMMLLADKLARYTGGTVPGEIAKAKAELLRKCKSEIR